MSGSRPDLAQVGAGFEAHAARYGGWLTDLMGERELRAIRPFLPDGATVLDYGCGGGRTTGDLLARGCQVTAYDLSPAMLAVARQRAGEHAAQVEWTAEVADLAGRTWPYIALIGVLDYYRRPEVLLADVVPLLAVGGHLVATVPNATSALAWSYQLASRFTVPAHTHRPGRVVEGAGQLGLECVGQRFACPASALLGHTAVLCFRRSA